MSSLIRFYTFELMDDATIESVTSENTTHPAEHAITPLEPNFAWQANESAASSHDIVIDLGSYKAPDGFCIIHHESEQTTPITIGLACSVSGAIPSSSLAQEIDYTDEDGNAVSGVTDDTNFIKIREFSGTYAANTHYRWWKFAFAGTTGPFYYPPNDMRISMLWLYRKLELDLGYARPFNDVTEYPMSSQPLPFGKTFKTGYSINPSVNFTRVWMVNDAQYAVLRTLMERCNGTYRPFLMLDIDGTRRLCKFASDTIQEEWLDVDYRKVTLKFVELPLLTKDAYH